MSTDPIRNALGWKAIPLPGPPPQPGTITVTVTQHQSNLVVASAPHSEKITVTHTARGQ